LALVKAGGGFERREQFRGVRVPGCPWGAALDERRRMMRSNKNRGEMPVEVDLQGAHGVDNNLFEATVSATAARVSGHCAALLGQGFTVRGCRGVGRFPENGFEHSGIRK
jgi:hypothetical protein